MKNKKERKESSRSTCNYRQEEKKNYQATAIQVAGERSTLLSDINPGYLSANPLI